MFLAEWVSCRYGIKREEQDSFSLRSHLNWGSASSSGRFDREIITIQSTNCSTDESPRPNLTEDKLAKLATVFDLPNISEAHANKSAHVRTVSAGNASSLNDGAAAVVLVSSSYLKNKLTSDPSCGRGLARVVSWAQSGGPPELMGIEVVPAVKLAVLFYCLMF